MSKVKLVSALAVAEYFLNKANSEKKSITNKKLQKLVYYAQAWSLVLTGKRLFSDKIEAWVHGPAVKSLYVVYKKFGFSAINKVADAEVIKTIPKKSKDMLDNIWSVYGKFDANYLEMLTHSETPWRDARMGLSGAENSDREISLDSMKVFYSEKLKVIKE